MKKTPIPRWSSGPRLTRFRARGRAGFELKRDQSLIDVGIAPTDGSQETSGKWKVDGDKLLFFKSSESKPTRKLEIISASPNRLVVKK